MDVDINAHKTALRRSLRNAPGGLSEDGRRAAERTIVASLLNLPEFREAETVALYYPVGCEVDITALFQVPGKRWLLPRYIAASDAYEMVCVGDIAVDLHPGKYRIPEPRPELAPVEVAVSATAFWLIPGVGFDSSGTRLGRGGGYYDRLLEGVRTPVAGVFFECQFVPWIPAAAHDRPLNLAVTEKSVRRFA